MHEDLIYGNGDDCCVAVFIRTGPIIPVDLTWLSMELKLQFGELGIAIDSYPTSDGVTVLLHSRELEMCKKIVSLPKIIESIDVSSRTTKSLMGSASSLMNNLMSLHCTVPLTQEILQTSKLYVAAAAGAKFVSDSGVDVRVLRDELIVRMSGNCCEALAPMRRVDESDIPMSNLWIQSSAKNSSLLRFCRPLSNPRSFNAALSRSVANAVVGGIGNGLLQTKLREVLQYSYNPYSMLTMSGGHQWILIDLDTARGFEERAYLALEDCLKDEINSVIDGRRVQFASNFMIRQREEGERRPMTGIQLQLALVEGTDPYGVSNVSRSDLEIGVDSLKDALNDLFDFKKLFLMVVSPEPQPTWFPQNSNY